MMARVFSEVCRTAILKPMAMRAGAQNLIPASCRGLSDDVNIQDKGHIDEQGADDAKSSRLLGSTTTDVTHVLKNMACCIRT